MRRKLSLCAIFMFLMFSASSAFSQAEFYVATAIPPGVGTKIKSLPYTISSPGLYYLGSNLAFPSGMYAVNIQSDGVTLDLMGFEISGNSQSIGIYANGNNITIRNGTIRAHSVGITTYQGKKNLRVSNVRCAQNWTGLDLSACESVQVTSCDSSENTLYGLAMSSGLVSGCTFNHNACGVFALGAANLLGNTTTNNTGYGVEINTDANVLIDRHLAYNNAFTNFATHTSGAITWGLNAGR
ncbi:right-handed parallel beta-helix repeat-containing protein [Fundidesulfovibrio soli]|uniref:right-handed parallel beta-helix repeat-containing protein n=1 Tax=Fundidesulfovibrio soli TaxID=2922716 RepID=UPI001FAF8F85|nr:right-handed parallel beta-helix repeat-containing protein [Fundidesulfovibrio soli]